MIQIHFENSVTYAEKNLDNYLNSNLHLKKSLFKNIYTLTIKRFWILDVE